MKKVLFTLGILITIAAFTSCTRHYYYGYQPQQQRQQVVYQQPRQTVYQQPRQVVYQQGYPQQVYQQPRRQRSISISVQGGYRPVQPYYPQQQQYYYQQPVQQRPIYYPNR